MTFKVVKGDLDVPGRHAVVMDETINNIIAKCFAMVKLSNSLSLNLRERGDSKSLFIFTGIVIKSYSFPIRKNRVN